MPAHVIPLLETLQRLISLKGKVKKVQHNLVPITLSAAPISALLPFARFTPPQPPHCFLNPPDSRASALVSVDYYAPPWLTRSPE